MAGLRKRIERLENHSRTTYDHEETETYRKAMGRHLGRKMQAFFHGVPYEGEAPERPDFLPPVENGQDYKQRLKDRLMRLKEANQ